MTPSDLMSAAAVRNAAERMLEGARGDKLDCWHLDLGALKQIARTVAHVTRDNYPDLNIPIHSRWRHFTVDGVDRWKRPVIRIGRCSTGWSGRGARSISSLHPYWSMQALAENGATVDETTQKKYTSSEGLALASLDLYRDVVLPAPGHALGAEQLIKLNEAELARVFQVRDGNPLSGVAGRVALLNKLGEACLLRPEIFAIAGRPRPGGLVDAILERTADGQIAASTILELLLDALGTIWPSRLTLEGTSLGDAWLYRPWQATDQVTADAIVPLHKLSQWLTYSLIEPLGDAGIRVTDVGGLTGLAEYRNGGLFVDGEVLRLKDPTKAALPHKPEFDIGDRVARHDRCPSRSPSPARCEGARSVAERFSSCAPA